MIERRPFNQLGGEDHGWLKAKHHFSFADYDDPARMGWGSLRIWNDDEIAPNSGFPSHPHANMEIITYVREGAVTHKDSLGNEGRTEAGDVQPAPVSGTPNTTWNNSRRGFSRSGSHRVTRAARPPGGRSPFPKPTVPGVS
jgi:quercetin 2,3-dioxygenase